VVTGFDDEDFAAFSLPSLTTVSQNLHEQGVMAGELLLRLLAGDDPGEVRVPVRLMVRGSTGCPPAVEAASESPREVLLWGQVAALDAVLATNRRFLSCGTEEEIVEQLALSMPLLGITRGFLVLRTDEPGPARGLLTMAYYDGRAQKVAPQEPFDLAHQLPEHLRSHLRRGTLVVQPLAVGDTEIGYLVLDQVLSRGSCIGEALRMDLSRTIDTIRSTARLSERTRQLESEATSRLAAQQALAYRVDHDSLTGLATRTAFLAHAEPAVADCALGAAMMVVDLDRFKDVNDTLGHDVGDALLIEVARRLSALVASRGSVCRLGGDEFAVLLAGVGTPDRALAIAVEVVVALRDHFRLDGLTLEIDGSVGVAFAPQHAGDAATLLRMADLAMYSAKSEHSGVALYDPSRHADIPRRLAVFGELRRALTDHELVLHYQPVMDMATGQVSGVEALVRWQHPARGLLTPSEFLDVAEQTGLIHLLTTYVLDQALRDCRRWLDQGLSLVVAVNLSTRRLMDYELPGEVAQLLAQHGVPASLLVLEVTETAAMADPARALSVLYQLRRLGVHLSVDDFGTGHASLAYLSRLPVTALKIDRSFVLSMESDSANMTIVRSTLDLARNLGLQVIAEGVETGSAYRALASFGCDQAQGFWLATPGPANDIPRVITDLQQRLLAPTTASQPLVVDPARAGIPQPRTHSDSPVNAPPPQ
jgi:diguanylate cyclase (GGDEF)-like protein